MLCIAQQKRSIGVNVVSEGSPSLILRVLLISFGITIRPRSSTRLTIPVAVPDIFVGFQKPSSSVDRGHSLRSLYLPSGSAPIAPQLLSFCLSPFCICRGRRPRRPAKTFPSSHDGLSWAPAPTIILQITLLVSVKEKRLYRHKKKNSSA